MLSKQKRILRLFFWFGTSFCVFAFHGITWASNSQPTEKAGSTEYIETIRNDITPADTILPGHIFVKPESIDAPKDNLPPILDPIGPQTVKWGRHLYFEFSATDPDGPAPTFEVSGLPMGSMFVWYHNVGNGYFSWTPTSAQIGTHYITIYAVDQYLETDFEVVEITVLDADEPYFMGPVNYTTSIGAVKSVAADFNGDYFDDLATVNIFDDNMTLYINQGDGTFSGKIDYSTNGSANDICCGDFDLDGDMDIATAGDVFLIFENNGMGQFSIRQTITLDSWAMSMCSGDFDNDGDIDLAVDDSYVEIYKNDGNGNFSYYSHFSGGNGRWSMFSADIDGDMDLDIATVCGHEDYISVLFNGGTGVFTGRVDYTTGNYPSGIYLSDIDTDGDNDILVVNQGDDNLITLFNNGYGSFYNLQSYPVGIDPRCVIAADINNDGNKDIVTGNMDSYNITLLLGNGNGSFNIDGNYESGSGPNSVLASDFDGDGNFDICAANNGGYPQDIISILMNNRPDFDYGFSGLFSDGFQDGASFQWATLTGSQPGNCIWEVDGNTYSTRNEGYNQLCLRSVLNPNWYDYTYSVRVRSNEGVCKEVAFRSQDGLNTYDVNLVGSPINELGLNKVVNGYSYPLANTPFYSEENRWYYLKIECIGNTFNVYVDNFLALTVTDYNDPFLNGGIGLVSWTGAEGISDISFDNVSVSGTSSGFDFEPNPDGWNFGNGDGIDYSTVPPDKTNAIMWPVSWWQQFEGYGEPYTYPMCDVWGPGCKPADIFPDWPLFVDVFGEDRCYMGVDGYGNPIFDPVAVSFWRDNCYEWGGSCFGFSTSAFLYFWDFIMEGSAFDLYFFDLIDGIRSLINEYQIHQWGIQFQNYENANWRKTPSQTLAEVKEMVNEGGALRFLCMAGVENSTGNIIKHAVCPWQVVQDPQDEDVERIYIYDNNGPGREDLYIRVNKDTDWWYYDAADLRRRIGLFLGPPVVSFLNTPLIPGTVDPETTFKGDRSEDYAEYFTLLCPSGINVIVTNESAEQIGNVGEVLFSDLTDGMHIINYGPFSMNRPGYYLPQGEYSVTYSTISDTSVYFHMFNDTTSLFCNLGNISTDDQDTIVFFSSERWMNFINDENFNDNIELKAITALPDSYFVFSISGISAYSNDSLGISLAAPRSVNISNHGESKVYDLSLNLVTTSQDTTFAYYNISIDSNSSHLLSPVWSGSAMDTLVIYVDYNFDGLADDSTQAVNGEFTCGDVDGSGSVNILDVTYLIDYLYKGGPASQPIEASDVNSSGGVNLLDVTYIISYLYKGGPDPDCP